MSEPAPGRTFPSARGMDRIVMALLSGAPPEMQAMCDECGLDLQDMIRFRPLAEIFALARAKMGWTLKRAVKFTGLTLTQINHIEAGNTDRLGRVPLVPYAARLGMAHLLGEWVTANPVLALTLGLPEEPEVLAQARAVLAEDARLRNLLPASDRLVMPPRFEAPPHVVEALDPDRIVGQIEAVQTRPQPPSSGESPDLPQGFAGPADPGFSTPDEAIGDAVRSAGPRLTEEEVARLWYRFVVVLDAVRPGVTRCIDVPARLTFEQFHEVLQVVMGWEDGHEHEFEAGTMHIGLPDPDWPHPVADERKVRLADLQLVPGDQLLYRYDFGDNWRHILEVESVGPGEPGDPPRCVSGKNACPPEDCGGPAAYADILHLMAHPKDPRHEEIRDWLDGDFDPRAFDATVATSHLARLAQMWEADARRGRRRKKG